LQFNALCDTIGRLIQEEVCFYGYCNFRRADHLGAFLLQSSEEGGISAISGQSNSYFSKSKSKTFEAKLALGTKIAAAVFVVLSLLMLVIK
jgi:preprotein translocase subunit SecG